MSAIVAAALIAGAGLAAAQQTNQQPNMPGNANQPSQNLYQNQTGAANSSASKRATSAKQGRSASVKKHHYARCAMTKHHWAKREAMKGTNQGRSAMTKKSQKGAKTSQPSTTY